MEPTSRTVTSGNGTTSLAVREYGDPAANCHLVLIHGFPDDQDLWVRVIEHLPRDWHVVSYDTRGAGESSRPREVAAYRTGELARDFAAVVAATIPDGDRFHVGAHDWGSIAFWDVLAGEGQDPVVRGRIASFTSASGPSLDHLGSLWSSRAGKRRLLRQGLHSWYVWMFQLPGAPEFTWRRMQKVLRPAISRLDPTIDALPWGPSVEHNAVPSVNLYRANVVQTLRHPKPWRTNVPVRLLIALQDGFVTPRSLEGLQARCRTLSRVDVDDGHWHVRTQPEFFAAQLVDHVRAHQIS